MASLPNSKGGRSWPNGPKVTVESVDRKPEQFHPKSPQRVTGRRNFKPTLPSVQSSVTLTSLAALDTAPGLGCHPSTASTASSEHEGRHGEHLHGRHANCALSVASSGNLYSDPSQVLIFLDWDDTLFPSTELFHRRELPEWGYLLPEDVDRDLEPWREALHEYLFAACSLSERLVIVTNSKRPWVDACIQRCVPRLRPLFQRRLGGPTVVYADEAMRAARNKAQASAKTASRGGALGALGCCLAGVSALIHSLFEEVHNGAEDLESELSEEELKEEATEGKRLAMEMAADEFYSRYPGQTWKNIISLGDMRYEYDAVQELSSRRVAQPRERLRTKAVLLPGGPSLRELTSQLQLLRLLLPALVRFNGDVDLDLRSAADPLQAIAEAMHMPQLGAVGFPLHAWGREAEPEDDEDILRALDEVAIVVHEALEQDIRPFLTH